MSRMPEAWRDFWKFWNVSRSFREGFCCRLRVQARHSGDERDDRSSLRSTRPGIGEGDEVLVSASTNIATALGVYHNGALPVPVDSEERNLRIWHIDLVEFLNNASYKGHYSRPSVWSPRSWIIHMEIASATISS